MCTPCHVLCGSVALKSSGGRTKLCALYSQMSDVEAGGATVFPDLGAAIWPKKVSFGSQGSDVGAGLYGPQSRSSACLTLTSCLNSDPMASASIWGEGMWGGGEV